MPVYSILRHDNTIDYQLAGLLAALAGVFVYPVGKPRRIGVVVTVRTPPRQIRNLLNRHTCLPWSGWIVSGRQNWMREILYPNSTYPEYIDEILPESTEYPNRPYMKTY